MPEMCDSKRKGCVLLALKVMLAPEAENWPFYCSSRMRHLVELAYSPQTVISSA